MFTNSLKSTSRFLLSFFLLLLIFAPANNLVYGQNEWRKADELFEAMKLKTGSWAADIGSREGYYTVRMSPVVGDSGHIFAVDINAEALEDLHENLLEKEIENVTPVFSVYDNPMLPARSLDAVLIRNAYHEFTAYMEMLRHIRKALKPGGLLVMAEPMSRRSVGQSREEQAERHDIAVHFAREDLEKAGFVILKEVDPFTETRRNQHYWLIVAERPGD